MSCTVNHLLIERGERLRAAGHFIMEGRDKMERSEANLNANLTLALQEADRLRAVNAKLVTALEALERLVNIAGCSHFAGQAPKCDYCIARKAIEEARK